MNSEYASLWSLLVGTIHGFKSRGRLLPYRSWADCLNENPLRRRLKSVVAVGALCLGNAGHAQIHTTYESWRTANFTPAEQTDDAVSGLTAQPHSDGYANLLKYALGMTVDEEPSGMLPTIAGFAGGTGSLIVTFDRPAGLTDVTYEVQFSSDLAGAGTWSDGTLIPQDIGGGFERVTSQDPQNPVTGPRFARLRVIHESGVIEGPAQNLSATPTSPTEVSLSWESEGMPAGFLIEQSTDGGAYEIVGFTLGNTKNYLVKNLLPGQLVRFRASAVGAVADGTPSNEASALPDLGTEGAVLLRFKNTQTNSDVAMSYEMIVENSTSEAIPLDELTIRYWVDFDTELPLQTPIYYATAGTSGQGIPESQFDIQAIPAASPQDGADYHVDFNLEPGSGTLPAGTPSQPGTFRILGAMHKGYQSGSFSASNDFSYLGLTEFRIHNRINVLRNGERIFGIDPGGGTGGPNRPDGPNGLTALPMSESSIGLAWSDLADDETLFVIERDFDEEPDGFKILATVQADSVGFDDLNLLDEATYSYRVRAVNPDGVSGATNTATATTLEGTSPQFTPLAPTGLIVDPFSSGRLDVGWTDASRNEKGFRVERQSGAGAFELIASVAPGTVSFVDYGLDPSTSYNYRVTSYNLAGSAIGVPGMGTTDALEAPAAPSDADIVRFLRQATFGPTPALVEEVRTLGFEAWLDAQFALAPTLHHSATVSGGGSQQARHEAWWQAVLTGADQARQRLAFALSQIFVVSEFDGDLANEGSALANYYDMLVTAPESNFRELLEDITFSPVMGMFSTTRAIRRR